MRKLLKEVYLYETGRVSVIWEAYTKSEQDTLRWAVLAPPSSGYKRRYVAEWLSECQERAQQLRNQLQEKGLMGED